jgi:uncharacterized protein involved in outer membrane biogenesis
MSSSLSRPRHLAHRVWAPGWLQRRPRPVRIAARAVAIVLLLLFAIWLVLFVTKGRFLKGPFESVASSMLEREVEVGGDFNLYFAPFNVKFMAEDMRISNPEWARSDNFFTAGLIDTRISTLPLIVGRQQVRWINLQDSRIALEWDELGRRNSWTFGDPNAPPEPFELPEIRRGTITGTQLTYRDPKLKLFADIGIDTVKAQDTAFDSDIRFSGKGRCTVARLRWPEACSARTRRSPAGATG